MIFTRAGRVLAWLLAAFGTLHAALGFIIASMDDPAEQSRAALEYLGRGTTGEAIDQGLYVAFIGVALGILAEISTSLRRRLRPE